MEDSIAREKSSSSFIIWMTDDDGGGSSFWFLSGWVGGLVCFEDQDESASPVTLEDGGGSLLDVAVAFAQYAPGDSGSRLAPIMAVRISTLSCSVASFWDTVVFWRPVILPSVVLSDLDMVVPAIAKPGISCCNHTSASSLDSSQAARHGKALRLSARLQALFSFSGRGYHYGQHSLTGARSVLNEVWRCTRMDHDVNVKGDGADRELALNIERG